MGRRRRGRGVMNERAHSHAADANQAKASDPRASAWVSASAGTGKTEVLVRRVLRLLLADSPPEKILCLTYTKTAAAEMQNRLLKELAAWATIAAEDLRQKLDRLLGRDPLELEINGARRLFARTLEAKGGLKIYTIHGFCERLLQRFPLEADVTPHFKVLDETETILHREAAFDAVVARAVAERDTQLAKALARIIAVTGEDPFREVVDAVLAKRAELKAMMAWHDGVTDWPGAEREALKRLFGLDTDDTEEALTLGLAAVLSNGEIDTLLDALSEYASVDADKKLVERLIEARSATGVLRADALRPVFLTTANKVRDRMCTAGLQRIVPALCETLDSRKARYAELFRSRMALVCAEASGAVLLLADRIQAEYTAAKRSEAVLDYEDLILKARDLLSRAGAAAWVLFKIDGGIDHILVDEAQDTNPEQWQIVTWIADEFFAGASASDRLRTLFAVGDEKQSIYSFQGADPARFGAVGRDFRAKALAIAHSWIEVPLTLSFRSTEPILEAVDAVFGKSPAADGLTWDATTVIQHDAFRQGEAGLVELWPIEKETKPDPAHPFEPWSNEKTGMPRAVDALCQKIAKMIKGWLANGEELVAAGRPVKPGDILILVRRREPFTAPIIRALKRADIPVAGADRMQLLDQLAVKDLMSLADFLLMPDDDLALAIVLKSPLFGLDDDDLFALAFERRRTSLWDMLRAKSLENRRFAEAADRLSRWLSRVDFAPPYEFFLELLGEDGQVMRTRMLTRLGPEAAEALDEFLDLALAFDREEAPSLQGFINDLRLSDLEIKRDMEQERDEVRIMTVHGAKGLQAPIVFLPDTCTLPRSHGAGIYTLPRDGAPPGESEHIVWPPGGSNLVQIDAAKARVRQLEDHEYHRQLYVAMTRAQDRLYIAGWRGQNEPPQDCWYNLVKQGLAGLLTEAEGFDGMTVQRLASKQTEAVATLPESGGKPIVPPLPDWASKTAAPERSREVLMPSRLGLHSAESAGAYAEQPPLGPKALADDRRFARGRLVHTLLQHLPQIAAADQERSARAFVAARGSDLPAEMREEIVSETLAIVRDPRFAPLFSPGSLGEVPVVARFGAGEDARELSGQIDRLAVLDDALLVLDYKTNRPPPATLEEVAPGYIAQLAAYRAALRLIYPARALRAAIVWTDGPKLMEIPSTSLDLAEHRILRERPQP
jgi:ATP-dependent helicase/nuclease subunit A